MSDSLADNHSSPRAPSASNPPPALLPAPGGTAPVPTPGNSLLSLDAPALLESVAGRWSWLVAGGAALAIGFFVLGQWVMAPYYSARVQLVRYQAPPSSDAFTPREFSTQTLAAMLQSPELLPRVAEAARPPMLPEKLARDVKVTPERNSDILTLNISGATPAAVVALANTYARTAVEFTQELQARDAAEEQVLLQQQRARIEDDIVALNQAMRALPNASLRLGERYQSLTENLEAARAELANLKPFFNEDDRRQRQREKVAALEKQIYVINQLEAMEDSRLVIAARERAAELFEKNPPGYFRIFGAATEGDVRTHDPAVKILALTIFGAMLGTVLTAGLLLLVELCDGRLKTAADVARVSELPVLATLGNLRRLKSYAQTNWATRAWSVLQHRLVRTPSGAMVCGVISSRDGEGRSTWISLLARAASQRGLRVLTVATDSLPGDDDNETDGDAGGGATVRTNVLATSSQVTERLIGPNPQTLVHISLPRWTWTLKRRQQWRTALEHWMQIADLVILVEMPPASVSESLLLAESIPNLLWLVDAGETTAGELREHVAAFRQARCHVMGAALNHEPPPVRRSRFFQPALQHAASMAVAAACFGIAATSDGVSPFATPGGAHVPRSAELHSAVSQTCSLQTARTCTARASSDGMSSAIRGFGIGGVPSEPIWGADPLPQPLPACLVFDMQPETISAHACSHQLWE